MLGCAWHLFTHLRIDGIPHSIIQLPMTVNIINVEAIVQMWHGSQLKVFLKCVSSMIVFSRVLIGI